MKSLTRVAPGVTVMHTTVVDGRINSLAGGDGGREPTKSGIGGLLKTRKANRGAPVILARCLFA
jgi:hypothetical protein